MAYKIKFTKNFEKDIKRCKKRGYDMTRLHKVIDALIDTGKAPDSCKPHKLSGKRANEWECHIGADWILIWEQNDDELTLMMISTGSHSDLF